MLAYAPLIERRLRAFRKPHCGSIRVDETYIKIRGQWRYLYRAIDKHGTPVDFLLTAKRDLEAAKRFFRKALQDQPLLSPDRIGTDGAGSYPPAIAAARKDGLLARTPVHYVTKHLQQGIESDHFRVKRPMPRVGCFQAFHTARRTIQGFEAMLWLRKGFGFAGAWTVREQNRLLALCFGLPRLTKCEIGAGPSPSCGLRQTLRHGLPPEVPSRGSTHGAVQARSMHHTVRPITGLLSGAPQEGRTDPLVRAQTGAAVGVVGAQVLSLLSRPRGLAL